MLQLIAIAKRIGSFLRTSEMLLHRVYGVSTFFLLKECHFPLKVVNVQQIKRYVVHSTVYPNIFYNKNFAGIVNIINLKISVTYMINRNHCIITFLY